MKVYRLEEGDLEHLAPSIKQTGWQELYTCSTSARHDLNLLHSLYWYPQPQIKAAALRKMVGCLWYLSEGLIFRDLFDADRHLAAKLAVLKASEQSWKRSRLFRSGSSSDSGLSSKKFSDRFRARMQNFFTVGLLRVRIYFSSATTFFRCKEEHHCLR